MLLLDSQWALFLGRFHPFIVAIYQSGFFLIAVLFEVLDRTGKQVVGSIGCEDSAAVLRTRGHACLCARVLCWHPREGYDEVLLSNHMWKSIVLATVTWLCWLLKAGVFRFPRRFYFPAVPAPFLHLRLLLTIGRRHDGGSFDTRRGVPYPTYPGSRSEA